MKKQKQKIDKKAQEDFRNFLVKHTSCSIQSGMVKGKRKDTGWPCGTCTIDLLSRLGLDSTKNEYWDSNKVSERHNEVWRALLQIREAK